MIKVISLLIFAIGGCPFTSFEKSVIPTGQNSMKITKQVHVDSEEFSFSIGFWTLSQGKIDALSSSPFVSTFLQIYGNDNSTFIGREQVNFQAFIVDYFICSVEENDAEQLKNGVKYQVNAGNVNDVNNVNDEIDEKDEIDENDEFHGNDENDENDQENDENDDEQNDETNQNCQRISYFIPFYDRLDNWIFTLITFSNNFNSIIIETSGQQKRELNIKALQQDHSYEFAIYCPQCSYMKPFRGKMSQLIFFENYIYQSTSFQQFQEYCQLPFQIIGLQTTNIVPGLIDFSGRDTLAVNFQEQGRKYCIQGWVKFPSSLYSPTSQILLRLSQNEVKPLRKLPGDELFKLQYFISPTYHTQSKVILQIDSYCYLFPFCKYQQAKDYYGFLTYNSLHFEYQNLQDDSIYKGITNWHYFQYEYGRNVAKSIGMLFQMQFPNSIGSFSQNISEIYQGSFTNGMFYVLIGETYSGIDQLMATIYDLKIIYNYSRDQELVLLCYKSCLTCDGPLYNNCLSCKYNFIYNLIQKQCACIEGYLEDEENQCIKQEEYFPFLTFQQQLNEVQNFCSEGQYVVPKSDSTFSCFQWQIHNLLSPQSNSNNILCADCWMNQSSWYLNPICTSDFLLENEIYILTNRIIQDYDFYIINNDLNLVYMKGFQGFCLSGPNCHSINNILHLRQKIQLTCKPNFIFQNNNCYSIDYYCLDYNENGQCLNCAESFYLIGQICKQCPENCHKCKYDSNSQKIICLQCINNYGFKQNQCFKCGLFCQICQEKKLPLSDQTLLVCLKCIDDSDYYVSFDKINCQKNEIKDCKYVIQYSNEELVQITYFAFNLDQSGIFTVCALCQNNKFYIYEKNICETQNAQITFCKSMIESQGQGRCYQADSKYGGVSYTEGCSSEVQNCNLCFQKGQISSCLQCVEGYYADRLFGSCQVCPPQLNCKLCAHQQKQLQDDWVWQIRPFLRQFMETATSQIFENSQSQKIEDYEIICKQCKNYYVLIKGLCLFNNFQSCQEFVLVEDNLKCISCQQNQINQTPTIINNYCISCPDNCAVCKPRSQDERNLINAQFNEEKYISYSYQCLKGKSDQFYYDPLISQFVNCNLVQQCKNQITIKMNLICSNKDYYFQLNQHISNFDKMKYKQENILLDDLFSEKSFPQYENDIFFKLANQNFVKEIYIIILNKMKQNCAVEKQATITQIFQEHIFSLQNVHLMLDFQEKVQINYSCNITFKNFQQLEFRNIDFIPTVSKLKKQIILTSFLYQKIMLQNISIIQKDDIQNEVQIFIDKVFQLEINNLTVSNIKLKDQSCFIIIKQQDQKKIIQIKQMEIKDSVFINTIIFQFNLKSFDLLVIDNFVANSIFKNSSLIHTLQQSSTLNINRFSEQEGTATFNDFEISSQIIDCQGFLAVEIFHKVFYSNFTISDSSLSNSTIINLYSEISINNLKVQNSQIYGGSAIILNKNSSNLQMKFNISNLCFENNEYESNIHFIFIQKLQTLEQQIDIDSLSFINNYGNKKYEIYKTYEKSLVYLEADNILISNLLLQKGFGMTELFIKGASNFTLFNTTITQDSKFKFRCLHQQFQCFNLQVIKYSFEQVISIYSVKQSFVSNLKIFNVQIFDFPIISYYSSDEKILEQEELFIFQNIEIHNNLLVQTKIQSTFSILQINSQQTTNLTFNECKFYNNILHSYIKNYLKISSLIFSIDCPKCNFALQNSQFTKNFITNSSDSIIYINTQSIQVVNCKFQYNSIFDYEIISQYLFWDDFHERIYFEQVAQVYQISSETGNGYLVGNTIQVQNTSISYSQGQVGGAFKFSGLDYCTIKLHRVTFFEIKTLFSGLLEQGGAMNIDGSFAQTLYIEFSELNVEKVFSQNEGGFLYLKLKNQQTKIVLKSIQIKDIYSQQGSFAFIECQQQSFKEQSLWLSNVTLQNSRQGFIKFINQYRVLSEQDKIMLTFNRTLFYINYGNNFYFTDFYLHNIDEGLFDMYGIQKLVLQNVEVQTSAFQIYLIKVTPQQHIQNLIEIKKLTLSQINQSIPYFDFNCFQKQDLQPLPKSQCNALSKEPKMIVEFYSAENYLNQIQNCSNLTLQNQSLFESQGLLIFNGLSELSKIIIFNTNFNQINCNGCKSGLIFCQYQVQSNKQLQQSMIYHLTISNSHCGQNGCLNLEKILKNEFRLIQNQEWQIQNNEINLNQYICSNNTAYLGVCLQVHNLKTILKNSALSDNKAETFGGAICIKGSSLFLMENCIIRGNEAQVGGGLYFENIPQINYLLLKNYIQENLGKNQGNNFKLVPEYLDLYLQPKIKLEQYIINSNATMKIIQAVKADDSEILLPSGQAMNSYQFFDQNKRTYFNPNYIFRIQAMQFDNSQSKNLNSSYCIIGSRKINESNKLEDNRFSNNYTNIKNITFDPETQQYNLDNLIIFFDPDQTQEIKLQLEFSCNSIAVLEYEEQFPFMLKHFHNNYKIRLNVRTLPCQYGEIKNQTNLTCNVCDSRNGFFSLKLNESKCILKEDESTISVKSALLELKQGYWRPYFDTSQVSYCYNKPENCLGGWMEGDVSCKTGNIGALCEQCDIFNIRGDGNFAIIENYQCGSCSSQTRNLILLIFTVLWTQVNLLISVQGNQKIQNEYAKPQLFYSHLLQKIFTKSQLGVLMKMLTSYLQILASLTTFQLNFPSAITNFLNITGNPIQTTANSQDCLLINHFHSGIQYIRAIWLLLMPIFYLFMNLIIFLIGSYVKLNVFNVSIISTSILHIYLYFQPNMIGNLMQLLSFRQVSGYDWIKANVAERYDNHQHFQWMLEFALPLLLVFGIVIPSFLLQHLVLNRKLQHKKEFKKIWGYLYHHYNQETHYWEIVKIFQKQLIIIFLSFFEEQIALKGIFLVLVQFAYSQLILRKKPYQITDQNDLDFSASNNCIVSICLGIGIYLSQQQKIMEVQIPFWIMLGYFNVKFLFLILSKIVFEYIKNFTSLFEINQIRIAFPFLKKIVCLNKYLDRKAKQKNKIKLLYKKLQQIILPLAKMSIIQQQLYFQNLKLSSISEIESIMQTQNRVNPLLVSFNQMNLEKNKQNQQ